MAGGGDDGHGTVLGSPAAAGETGGGGRHGPVGWARASGPRSSAAARVGRGACSSEVEERSGWRGEEP